MTTAVLTAPVVSVVASAPARITWRDLRVLWSLRQTLRDCGWLASARAQLPMDAHGNPLPWITYGAIDFLTPRIQPHWRVFEFGAGYSTLWWSSRVAAVVSVESDRAWLESISARLPAHVTCTYASEASEDYVRGPEGHGLFHVIVNDGKRRVACVPAALEALTPDGVILWDNSDRDYYAAGFSELAAAGFKRIDFSGLGPANNHLWMTTIFYRPNNCLGI